MTIRKKDAPARSQHAEAEENITDLVTGSGYQNARPLVTRREDSNHPAVAANTDVEVAGMHPSCEWYRAVECFLAESYRCFEGQLCELELGPSWAESDSI